MRYSKLSMMTATKRFSICGNPRGQDGAGESETHPNTFTQRSRGREGEREGDEMEKGRQRKRRGIGIGRNGTCSHKEPRQRDGGMEMWEGDRGRRRQEVGERGERGCVKWWPKARELPSP